MKIYYSLRSIKNSIGDNSLQADGALIFGNIKIRLETYKVTIFLINKINDTPNIFPPAINLNSESEDQRFAGKQRILYNTAPTTPTFSIPATSEQKIPYHNSFSLSMSGVL